MGSIPGWGRSPREGNGNPLQYSCPGNPQTEEPRGRQSMGLQKIQTQLSVMWESQDSFLPTVVLEVYGIWRSLKKGRA